MAGVNKRPVAPASAAPPLPPGPQPTSHEQAQINAAWTQYYASQTSVSATPSTPANSQANAAQYANYGYGAGAPMVNMASTPASATFPPSAGMQQAYPAQYMVPQQQPYAGSPAGYMPQQPQVMQYPHHQNQMYAQPQPQMMPMQPVMAMGPAQPQGMMMPQQQPQQWGQPQGHPQQPQVRPGGFRPRPGPGQGQGSGGPQGPRPGFAGPMNPGGGLGIAQPMAQPQQPPNQPVAGASQPGPQPQNFRPTPGGGHSSLPRAPSGIPTNPTLRNPRPAHPSLPAGPVSGPSHHHPQQQGPPAKRPRTDGPSSAYSPTPSMRSAGPGLGPSGPGVAGPRDFGARRQHDDDRYRDRRDFDRDRDRDRERDRDRFERRSDFGGSQDGGTGGYRSGYPVGGGGRGRGGRGGLMPRDRRDGPGASGSGGSIAGSSDSRFGGPSGSGIVTGGRGGLRGRGVGPGRGGAIAGSRFVAGNGVAGAPKGPSGRGTGIRGRGGNSSTRAGARVVGTRPVPAGKASGKDTSGKAAVVDTEREKVAKEEARKRTLTDFRIVGLEIKSLGWKWGVVRPEIDEEGDSDDDDDDGEEEAEEDVAGDVQEMDGKEGEELQDETSEEAAVERDVKVEPASASEVEIAVKVEQVSGNGALKETRPEVTPATLLDDEELATNEAKDKPSESQDSEVIVKAEQAERVDGEDKAAAVASSTLEGKRGEKRKAKMSSPDADDDALIMSKKRTTHGPVIRKETVALSPEKNRFRIYFASPVEDADGPSLKALHAMETVEEVNPDEGEEEEHDDGEEHEEEGHEQDGDEEEAGQGDDEGQEEFYEAQGEDTGETREAEQDGQQEGASAETEVHDESGPADGDEGDMSGVVEEEEHAEVEKPEDIDPAQPAEPAVKTAQIAEASQAEMTEQDVAMREPSIPPQTGPESLIEAKPDASAEKAVNEPAQTETETETETSTVAAPADSASKPTEPVPEIPAGPPSAKQSRQKSSAPLAPREPSSHRLTDARFRRSPSLPATSSDTPRPESNRLSILYANGKRRICLDSAIVESVKIHRKKGSIQVILDAGAVKRKWEQDKQVDQIVKRIKETEVVDEAPPTGKEDKSSESGEQSKAEGEEVKSTDEDGAKELVKSEEWSLTKGILVEALDEEHNVFGPLNAETLAQIWTSMDVSEQEEESPPLHRLLDELQKSGAIGSDKVNSAEADRADGAVEEDGNSGADSLKLELTAYLDMERPLTEPKWVKSGHVEDWIKGANHHPMAARAGRSSDEPDDASWRTKLKVIDPDTPPTLASVLENWALVSKVGSLKDRRRFANGHLSSLNNMVQILLRAVRGEETVPLSRSSRIHLHGPLKNAISPKDFYYTKQSHTSLAVMAIVNLVKDYSYAMKETRVILENKIGNIIKSMPNAVVFSATDSLYTEWVNQEPRGGPAGPRGA